jgi:hypothetical protein
MTHPTLGLLAAVVAALPALAHAGDTTVSATVTSDREEQAPAVPQSSKLKLGLAHHFDGGVVLGGSAEYADTAFSPSATVNLETTLGAHLPLGERLSLSGSVGVGGRLNAAGSNESFPYYVLRSGADLKLSEHLTWNAVGFRYRDAFDPDDDYLTPQLATGLTVRLDGGHALSGKVEYNWKDWKPDTVGVEFGYAFSF